MPGVRGRAGPGPGPSPGLHLRPGCRTVPQPVPQCLLPLASPPRGTHLHVPGGGAVVCPPEDLRHVPEDVDGGQQVPAVAGPVLGDLHQCLDDLRDPLPRQSSLCLGQVLSGLGRQERAGRITSAGGVQEVSRTPGWQGPTPIPPRGPSASRNPKGWTRGQQRTLGCCGRAWGPPPGAEAGPGAPEATLTIIWMFL